MANQDEIKPQAPSLNPIAAAMMAFGDGMQGIYGQRGNTYATYLDAQAKRQSMEMEAMKFQQQQQLAQQQLMVDKAKLRATIGENRSQAGLRTSQENYYNAQAKSQNALAGFYDVLGGNGGGQSGVQLDASGQPMVSPLKGAMGGNFVLDSVGGRQGPRFVNMDAKDQAAQIAFQNRAYSPEASKAISGSEALTEKLVRLRDMTGMDKGEGMGYLPFGGFDEKGQLYKSLRNDIQSTLVYLKSGAAINEPEFKRLKALLPGLFTKASVDKDQLNRFIKEYSTIGERIKSGAKWDKSGKNLITPEGITNISNDMDYEAIAKAAGI